MSESHGISEDKLEKVLRSIAASEESSVPSSIISLHPAAEAAAFGMEEWEREIEVYCSIFLSISKSSPWEHEQEHREWAAGWIGDLISKQLIAGNYSAPRIVSEALLNLNSKGQFKRQSGKKRSRLHFIVYWAFCILEFSRGLKMPAQFEIRSFLLEHGLDIDRVRLSKIIESIGLKSECGNANDPDSPAYSRRRRSATVAIHNR